MTTVRRRIGWRLLILSLCAFVLSFAQRVRAQPPLPHEFYGSLTIDGQPAPAGTTVEARGEGVLTDVPDMGNPITTEGAGQYGGPSPFDPKLIVQGEDLQNGDLIAFYVNGVRAEAYDAQAGGWVDSHPFQSGVTTELDLRAVGAPPDITPSSTPSPTATPTPTSELPSATPTERAPTPSPQPTARSTDTSAPVATATSAPAAGPSPTRTPSLGGTPSPSAGPSLTQTPTSWTTAPASIPSPARGTPSPPTTLVAGGTEEPTATAQPGFGGPADAQVTPSATPLSSTSREPSGSAEDGGGSGASSLLLILAAVLGLFGAGAIAFSVRGLVQSRRAE